MNLKVSLAALALLAVVSSCKTYTKTMREPNARLEFEKDDFIFSDQVGAKAREVIVLGIDWNRLFRKENGDVRPTRVNVPIIGSNIYNSKAASYALYNMMADHPGYDVVFYPQYSAKVSRPVIGIGFIVRITDIDVKARLAKIAPTEGHTDETDE